MNVYPIDIFYFRFISTIYIDFSIFHFVVSAV